VLALLVERSERATRLRHSSPFCGILTEAERRAIYESYSARQQHGHSVTRNILVALFTSFAVVFLVAGIGTAQAAEQNDEQLQNRYGLCMDKADRDFLEGFRGDCDTLCIRQKKEPPSCAVSITPGCCMVHHFDWNTANCMLPSADTDREERHLEQAKDRCLTEFKAGITAPP
jgi:hypothetical protein